LSGCSVAPSCCNAWQLGGTQSYRGAQAPLEADRSAIFCQFWSQCALTYNRKCLLCFSGDMLPFVASMGGNCGKWLVDAANTICGPRFLPVLRRGIDYATRRTVLRFKYRPLVAHRVHYRDGAYSNWCLDLSSAGSRYVNRTTLWKPLGPQSRSRSHVLRRIPTTRPPIPSGC
jgi:hypothetical protein